MSARAGVSTWRIWLIAALVAGVAGIGLATMGGDGRKVTFIATVGDGKTWAGGFTVTYTIGTEVRPVTVRPLVTGDVRRNRWTATRVVPAGTAVTLIVKADWPAVPIVIQMRGQGLPTKPVAAISPDMPSITATVR